MASVVPAPSPAVNENYEDCNGKEEQRVTPRKVFPTLVFPVDSSASQLWYASKLANRVAILGTIPDKTAPRPLYRASGVSRLTILEPVDINPRDFVYTLLIYRISIDVQSYIWSPSRLGELHTDFNGVERLTYELWGSENISLLNYEGSVYSLTSTGHSTSRNVGSKSDRLFVAVPGHGLPRGMLVYEE